MYFFYFQADIVRSDCAKFLKHRCQFLKIRHKLRQTPKIIGLCFPFENLLYVWLKKVKIYNLQQRNPIFIIVLMWVILIKLLDWFFLEIKLDKFHLIIFYYGYIITYLEQIHSIWLFLLIFFYYKFGLCPDQLFYVFLFGVFEIITSSFHFDTAKFLLTGVEYLGWLLFLHDHFGHIRLQLIFILSIKWALIRTIFWILLFDFELLDPSKRYWKILDSDRVILLRLCLIQLRLHPFFLHRTISQLFFSKMLLIFLFFHTFIFFCVKNKNKFFIIKKGNKFIFT